MCTAWNERQANVPRGANRHEHLTWSTTRTEQEGESRVRPNVRGRLEDIRGGVEVMKGDGVYAAC